MTHNAEDHGELLYLPLSPLATAQLIEITQYLVSLPATEDNDIWSYI